MSKVIRIGTRDSELALWQANHVKGQLENLGFKTILVPVKATGDLKLDKPLYQLGITGIFTKTLDVAMLKGEIDIAVHSLKDVPTVLPKGIVQAAVLERGNHLDILAFKDNEEFLAQPSAVIATGSLRRKAQWLNRYPTHTVVDLRGNVNSRHEKLKASKWNGAIFAAAGLDRIALEPKNTIGLTWMVPAPAQGAIMIAAMESDHEIREACEELNHKPTEICTTLEREFLNTLEGGCTAPIGALARINTNDEVSLKGILLTPNGSKKLEVQLSAPLGEHASLGKNAAERILLQGGKHLMNELQGAKGNVQVYSTKKLSQEQLQRFHSTIRVQSDDFIKISLSRISPNLIKQDIRNVIISSKNAVASLLTNFSPEELKFKNIYCVGRKTKRAVEQKIGKVTHYENNSKKLADYLVEYMEGLEAIYFCGNLRLNDLPEILSTNNITVKEIEAYTTKLAPKPIDEGVTGIMFYSPSTIESYLQRYKADKIAYCIGETTAKTARKYFTDVRVAKVPTAESMIDLVNLDYASEITV
ncbi:MAG: hydroxymethylbilane synthase [Bacteroidota bacterium]